MSIQSNNNFDIFNNFRHPIETETKTNVPFGTSRPRTDMPTHDVCELTGGMGANLKYNEDKSLNGTGFDGKLNNKDTFLNYNYVPENKEDLFEGYIGDKQISFIKTGNKLVGNYGGKDFDLTVDYQEPNKIKRFIQKHIKTMYRDKSTDYFNLNGTIGDRQVSYQLPNIPVPENEEDKDILSLALTTYGMKAKTFKKQIISLGYSNNEMNKLDANCMNNKDRNKQIKQNITSFLFGGVTVSGVWNGIKYLRNHSLSEIAPQILTHLQSILPFLKK